MGPETTVLCNGVGHRYRAAQALEHVSFSITRGSSTALLGPDGVGKSTLLGLIAGVRKLQTGQIAVFGGDMRSQAHRDEIAHRLAYMPQGLGRTLYPSLSVAENLDFMARLFAVGRTQRRQRIDHLLGAVGLSPFSDRPAGQLSGGMKQKLSLCCTLLHDPDILILDEPTTGIDPLSRRQFWALIEAIRAERPQMTLIMATAYMDEAARFGRVLVLDRGRIAEDGSVAEVLERTATATLEQAFARLHAPDDDVSAIGSYQSIRQHQDGPPAIRAQGLTRRFGSFTAVDNASFEIRRGEIFGFLGSNGCGKTTTMKMLTGLLPVTEGEAWLLGKPVKSHDLATRLDVGYMSQSFSLYRELSVRADLELHARLYRIAPDQRAPRIAEVLREFGLGDVVSAKPEQLPLGQRQRLQLAVACLHKPSVLILDEPTSGVDPAARDRFWVALNKMSRQRNVTIFVSTHFMGEATRCDRISLMHAGRVLAIGTPDELIKAKAAQTLDEAFVRYIEAEMQAKDEVRPMSVDARPAGRLTSERQIPQRPGRGVAASFNRIRAFAIREGYELMRDRIRLAFAMLGPIILMMTFGYGISFDVEDLRFAVLDRDQTAQSRRLIDAFAGSRYFHQQTPVYSDAEGQNRLRKGELRLLISIPQGYGRDILSNKRPEIGFFIDGTKPFTAETTRGYVQGIIQHFDAERAREIPQAIPAPPPFTVEPRFRYNQEFRSVFAMIPGSLMIIIAMIPAIIAAVGIVREREIGSISNLYTSPAGVAEFLLGKQFPYVVVCFASYVTLVLIAVFHFGLTIKGSVPGLLLAGLVYVFAATAFSILISSFTRTQVAALIATAVITQVPVLSFSGFLSPAGGLEGVEALIGRSFPAYYFQNIAIGSFAKARGFLDLGQDYLAMFGLGVIYLCIARLLVRKQEA